MSVSDILNRMPNQYVDITGTLDQIQKDSANLPFCNKFTSRVEIDAAGLSKTYDEAQSKGVRVAGYTTACGLMDIKLNNEQQALTGIKAAITQFRQELVNNSNVLGTNADKANTALATIQTILNTQNQDGSYVFGGNNPNTPPLLVDITQVSNFVDGYTLNNYSNTTSNTATIDLSSQQTIKVSYVHASMDEIAAYIGALNEYKAGAATAETDLNNADLAFGQLRLSVDTAIDYIRQGRMVNADEIQEASKLINDLFKEGVDVIAGNISDLRNSLFAGIAIQGLENKIFDRLMDKS